MPKASTNCWTCKRRLHHNTCELMILLIILQSEKLAAIAHCQFVSIAKKANESVKGTAYVSLGRTNKMAGASKRDTR